MKKKAHLLAMLFSLSLLTVPVLAQDEAPGSQNQDTQQQQQAMPMPGCRMLGGAGMGMGPGMGMGRGMWGRGMGHGMGRGMQPCMMGGCWQGGMGRGLGGMMNCPGPRMTVKNAFRELQGYQLHAEALGLNAEQLQRLAAIENTFSKALIETRAQLQIAALDFRQVMEKDLPDTAQVNDLIDQKAERWKQLQKMAVKAAIDARQILTQSQRQKAKSLLGSPVSMMQLPMEQDQEQEEEM